MPTNDDAYVWIGPLAGSWATVGNWEDTTTGANPALTSPGTNDAVTFNSPTTQFQVIEGVGSAASVAFNGDDAIAGTLDVGALTLNTGSLDVQAGATLQAATAVIGSTSSPESAGLTVSGSGAAAYFGTLDLDAIFVTPLAVTDGAYVQAATLVLGGVFSVAVSIDATSTLEVGTAGTAAAGVLTIDPGHELLADAAQIAADIENVVVNNGSLQAVDLDINGLAGSGAVLISQGASLLVSGAIVGAQAITLASNAQLVLGNSAFVVNPTFQTISATSSITLAGRGDAIVFASPPGTTALAPISGFNDTDALFVTGFITAAADSHGALVLKSDGTAVGTIDLAGSYSGESFFTVPVASPYYVLVASPYYFAQTEIVLAPGSLAAASAGTAGNSFLWDGPIAGDWNAATNWTDTSTGATPAAVAPGSHDTVIFNSPSTEIQVILGQADAANVTFNGDDAIAGTLAAGTLTQNAGVLDVLAGATLAAGTAQVGSATFYNGAGLTVSGSGAVARFGTLNFYGGFSTPLLVTDGGLVEADRLVLGGTFPIDVDSISTLEVGTAGTAAAGAVTIDPGATLDAATNSANDTINDVVVNNGSLEGHDLSIDALAGTGAVQIESGGALDVYGTVGSGQAILFSPGAPETLTLGSPGSILLNSVSGLAVGDRIEFAGLTITAAESIGPHSLELDVTPAGHTPTTYSLTNVELPAGTSFLTGTDILTGDGYIELACYVEGTRIETETGARPIETLRPGDRLLLAYGGSRPVVWLGHRRVDCRRHPRPRDVWPVCVRPGAFGPGQPHRDLLLSPDHAVFQAGVLIPVRHLIDGHAVVQVPRAVVTYWHVELDRHDVILAEGLACESYLDTGTRMAFAGWRVMRLHADFATRAWEAAGCAPLVVAGPEVEGARRLLRAWQGPPASAAAIPLASAS